MLFDVQNATMTYSDIQGRYSGIGQSNTGRLAPPGNDMANTGLVYSEKMLLHTAGDGHPERPERLQAIMAAFQSAGLRPARVEPRLAGEADLLRVYDPEHIAEIRETCAHNAAYPEPDTQMVRESWEAALLAASAPMSR